MGKLTGVIGIVAMRFPFLKPLCIAKIRGFGGTLITSFVNRSLSD